MAKKDKILTVRLDDADLQKDLRRAHRACVKMKPAWDEVGEIAISSILRNFREEGRPKKWAPFSPNTKRKRGNMASAKLLVDNDIMRGSLENKRKSIRVLNQHSVEVGTDVEYAVYHQKGKGNMLRPFIMVQDEDLPEMADALVSHIVKSLL